MKSLIPILISTFIIISFSCKKDEELNPNISINIKSLSFSSELDKNYLIISNSGKSELFWNISDKPDWINPSKSYGQISTGTDSILITANTDLDIGNYSGKIKIESNGGTAIVDVFLSVEYKIEIYPGVEAAKIKLGETYSKVDEIYGEPDSHLLIEIYYPSTGVYKYLHFLYYNSVKAVFEIINYTSGFYMDDKIISIQVEYPYDGLTDKLIGIGSSLSDVIAAYGQPPYINTDYDYYKYGSSGISFYYENEHVTEIEIYYPVDDEPADQPEDQPEDEPEDEPEEVISDYTLSSDETWNDEITLDKNINIPSNRTLTLLPGTKIKITKEIKIDVDGKFIAKGTSDNIIEIFMDENISTDKEWWGIGVGGSSSEVIMEYCAISGSGYGLFIYSSSSNAPEISNCLFHNLGSSIVDFGGDINLQYNSFENVGYGCSRWGEFGQDALIEYCEFINIDMIAINISGVDSRITDGADVVVKYSNFLNNSSSYYDIKWSGNGNVINSTYYITNCYGIKKTVANEYNNTVVIENNEDNPVSNAGCGFSVNDIGSYKKKSISASYYDIQHQMEKDYLEDLKNKLQSD